MEEIRTHARLVDPAASSLSTRGLSTVVPRAEIEEVLHRGEYPAPLFLDIARVDGERDDEVAAHARLMVGWDEPTLRELLRTTTDTEIRLSFDAEELERVFDEGDVEAHGLREKMAVLAVAAAAAGAGAGAAAAGPQVGMMSDGGGSSATAPAASTVVPGNDANPLSKYVASVDASQATAQTPSFTSDVAAGGTGSPATTPAPSFTSDVASGGTGSAPDALSRYVANVGDDAAAPAPDALSRYVANVGDDAAAQAPSFTSDVASGGTGSAPDALGRYVANVGNDTALNAPEAATTGSGSSISLPSPAEGAGIAAGIVLLITGAGFMAVRSRRPPELPA